MNNQMDNRPDRNRPNRNNPGIKTASLFWLF